MEERLTLAGILNAIPRELPTVASSKPSAYPVLTDSMGRALFPPIIKHQEIGEVKHMLKNVLIEVMGTEPADDSAHAQYRSTSFYDRGANIEPVSGDLLL